MRKGRHAHVCRFDTLLADEGIGFMIRSTSKGADTANIATKMNATSFLKYKKSRYAPNKIAKAKYIKSCVKLGPAQVGKARKKGVARVTR